MGARVGIALADPDVEIQVGTVKMRAPARTAKGEERTRLRSRGWNSGRPYAEYQLATTREIPVVVLDPVR